MELAGSTSLPQDTSTPDLKFKPHRKGRGVGWGHRCQKKKREMRKQEKKIGESMRQMEGETKKEA